MKFKIENERMINWLLDKPAIILHAAASSLNWGFAGSSILWIVSQKKTDYATAAKLFLLSCPSNAFPTQHGSELIPANSIFDSGVVIRSTISGRWNTKNYSEGQVEYDVKKSDQHGLLLELMDGERQFRSSALLPWESLIGIEGPFHGEQPKPILDYVRHSKEDYFRVTALFQDLGSNFGEIDVKVDPQFIAWRIESGFGKKPNWGN
jgi:hypothetical protein